MSLDTKQKRASVFGVGRPWMRDKFPVATPGEEWRISSGNAYGGNALSAGADIEGGFDFVLDDNRGHFVLGDNRGHFVLDDNKGHFTPENPQ